MLNRGGTPSQVTMGVPPSKVRTGVTWGTPSGDRMGVPPIGTGCGTPPSGEDRGTPHQDWMGVPHPPSGEDGDKEIEQQSEHLLGGGRYASFLLTLIHASVISLFPEFAGFTEKFRSIFSIVPKDRRKQTTKKKLLLTHASHLWCYVVKSCNLLIVRLFTVHLRLNPALELNTNLPFFE